MDSVSASEVDYDPTLALGREMRKNENQILSVTSSNTLLSRQFSVDKQKKNVLKKNVADSLMLPTAKELVPKSVESELVTEIQVFTNFVTILPVTPGSEIEDLWLDDINSIAMLFHNVYLAGRMGSGRIDSEIEQFMEDIFNNIVPEAFTQAFKIILGILWEDPILLSVKVLGIVKQKSI